MEESAHSSIQNKRIMVSRNSPVAFLVGVAGFIGSTLAEKLLSQGIQVIGVDDLSSGNKANLSHCVKDRNFHFLSENIADPATTQKLGNLELPRIDYAFFVADSGKSVTVYTNGVLNFLHFIKSFKDLHSNAKKEDSVSDKPRVLLCSSIDLYDTKLARDKKELKDAEVKFAKFVRYYHLNARVVRLASVYGPRMHFREFDPINRLIQVALNDELQKEQIDNEFSSRAIFIDDAIELLLKSILSGGTSHQIYDGALYQPVKISEIKQILLNPLWHQEKNFKPSELPPWPTPNLKKTMSELSWKPKTNIVEGLRLTVSYFKENEGRVPEVKKNSFMETEKKWSFSNPEIYGDKNVGGPSARKKEGLEGKGGQEERGRREGGVNFGKFFSTALIVIILILGLVYPIGSLILGGVMAADHLKNTRTALEQGDFAKAKSEIAQAKQTTDETGEFFKSLVILKRLGILNNQISSLEQANGIVEEGMEGVQHAVLGSEALFKTTKVISGDDRSDPKPLYETAETELTIASEKISKVQARLDDKNFLNQYPDFLKNRISEVESKIGVYQDLVDKARVASIMMPQITAVDGKKSYLVLFQNNLELRPTGGFIGSYGKFDFENGRLTGIKVDDIYNLDGGLKDVIEPPQELKNTLHIDRWYLRDSNWDPDFPTSARQAMFFYKREGGDQVNGVVALDLTASGKLLSAVGGIDLPDYGETVDGDNLFEKAITHAEVGFFPGSQAKKNYLVALQTQLFNKVFYLSKQNWPGIISALGSSLEEKHMLVFMEDPKVFSYLASQNWSGILPRPGTEIAGETNDLLVVNEANIGANKSNYYLKRDYKLNTVFDKDGGVTQNLKIHYNNTSPSDVFPAGTYKNLFRMFVPLGAKIEKVRIGENDVTDQVSAFSDYGRSGFQYYFEVGSKEIIDLNVSYKLANGLNFKNGQAVYRLDFPKQAGTMSDPLEWTLNYPINFQVEENRNQAKSSTQQLQISSDLSQDRSFQVTIKQK